MNLEQFLNNHRITNDDFQKTHTSLYPPGKYSISSDEKRQFYLMYMNALAKGECLSLVELQTTTSIPLIVDVDLNMEVDIQEHHSNLPCLYSETHLKNISEAFLHVLQNYLDPKPSDEHTVCFVMERDGYTVTKNQKTLYKNGFHLHFPYCILSRTHIKHFIIPQVIQYLEENACEIPSMVNYDTLFDTSIYDGRGKPWFMYGSQKPIESLKPYLVTHVYKKENSGRDIFKDLDWEKYLLPYELTYTTSSCSTSEDDEDTILSRHCLVEIFSLQCEEKPEDYFYELDTEKIEESTFQNHSLSREEDKSFGYTLDSVVEQTVDSEKDFEFFDRLLNLLPNDYAEDYNKWMQIGWIVFNYYDGHSVGFDRWDEFSKRSTEKYKYEDCLTKWNTMNRQNKEVGMGTLRFIVRKHRPLEYKELCNEFTDHMIENLIHNTTHFDLAKILHVEFQDIFVCSSIKHNDWYEFKDHVWVKNDDGIFLRSKISTYLVAKYEKLLYKYMNNEKKQLQSVIESLLHEIDNEKKNIAMQETRLNSTNDPGKKKKCQKEIDQSTKDIESLEDKLTSLQNKENGNKSASSSNETKKKSENELYIEKVQKIIFNLKTSPFKRNIMSEAKELFYDATFEGKLNSCLSKVAFNNGVYDLENHVFREGLPSDHISLKMEVNYRNDFTMQSPEVKDAELFFKKIFPDEKIRAYFLGIQSEIFWGRNTRKLFQLWTGVGDNGKSITQAVFERLLGPYCSILPTALLTQKRTASSSASPELVRAGQGCRLCFMQEPSKTDKFNVGLLKELSGNDKFYARPLHRDPIDIVPMFKIVCIANHPPVIENSQTDEAVWKRVKIIPFQSKFPKHPQEVPDSIEEQFEKKIFPRDDNFSDKIDAMLEGVAYLLMYIYRNKYNNVDEPEDVSIGTKKFRNKCDSIGKFIDICVDVSEEAKGSQLTLKTFYFEFRKFLKENLPDAKTPSIDDVEEYLEDKWGSPEENKWQNVQIKMDTD